MPKVSEVNCRILEVCTSRTLSLPAMSSTKDVKEYNILGRLDKGKLSTAINLMTGMWEKYCIVSSIMVPKTNCHLKISVPSISEKGNSHWDIVKPSDTNALACGVMVILLHDNTHIARKIQELLLKFKWEVSSYTPPNKAQIWHQICVTNTYLEQGYPQAMRCENNSRELAHLEGTSFL
ncbi:hypothetical protein AVEN_157051-1 [Araneus ventricosus]|uniref:Uncharacterized protein n=1 Tax=Araneus ventricosus TaxID=182803 RepID=A0A4Y2VIP6_ARAVE|nr:hypothetical protein AVEN_157051-1 [Araneus ventricosus]